MKQPILVLALSTALFSMSNNALATPTPTVMQFNPKTETWGALQPPDFTNNMSFIETAGPYAWAVNNNNDTGSYAADVTFFNGSSWQPINKDILTDNNLVMFIYPTYAITGSKPQAWAMGWNVNTDDNVISFFDGKNWNLGPQGKPILFSIPGLLISASDGYLCLIQSQDPVSYEILSPANYYYTDKGFNKLPDSIAINFVEAASTINSNPYAFIAGTDYSYTQHYIIRIDETTNTPALVYSFNIGNFSPNKIVTMGNTVVVLESNNSNQNQILYSLKAGDPGTWQQLSAPISVAAITQNNVYNNGKNSLLCGETTANNQFSCIDLSAATPSWKNFQASAPTTATPMLITDSQGAWIIYSFTNDGKQPHVYYYNFAQGTVKDTGIPAASIAYNNGILPPEIFNNHFMIIGKTAQNTNVIFSYDGNTWTTTSLPVNYDNNFFSSDGNDSNISSMGNIWAFGNFNSITQH